MLTRPRSFSALLAAALVSGALVVAPPAQAGPPLICHPVDIGDAKCLPWGSAPFKKSRGYSPARLVDDTLAILASEKSVLVHMETLRRAALYVDRNESLATRLLGNLMARALDAEAAGKPGALAWFDAGYLAQCYEQLRIEAGITGGKARGLAGYGWVRHALQLQGDDAEMEFAAAMMTVMAGIPEHAGHVARVMQLADDDSLVVRNLEVHSSKHWSRHRSRRTG